MPRAPKMQKRPADMVGSTDVIARIAAGEENSPASKAARLPGGLAGMKNRVEGLSPAQRTEIAKKVAKARSKQIGKPN